VTATRTFPPGTSIRVRHPNNVMERATVVRNGTDAEGPFTEVRWLDGAEERVRRSQVEGRA